MIQFEETSRKGNLVREAFTALDIDKRAIQTQLDEIAKRISTYSQQISEHKAKFADLQPGMSTLVHGVLITLAHEMALSVQA